MTDPAISVRGLTVSFGRRRILDGLDLDIDPGTATVLLGRNGAGKTTLLRCLLGLLRPDAGEIRVLGADPVRRPASMRRRTGWVPDRPDAEPWMTPRDLFSFLRAFHRSWSDAEARRLALAFSVPLETPFRRLSRGEGMKAMIAAALAPDPELLILDEPFAGLDPLAAQEVLRALIAEARLGVRTVLCATHDLDVAARLADRVVIIEGGRAVRPAGGSAPTEDGSEETAAPAGLREVFLRTVGAAGMEVRS